MDLDLTEKKIDGEVIYRGKIVTLEVDRVTLPNGNTSTREVIRHNGAVCVLPLTDDGCVICVNQYRYPHERVMLELPAGKIDAGESDRELAARRELREETGAVADRLTFIGDYIPSPAILGEVIGMYLAEGLHFGETDPDDDEFLTIERIPLTTLCDMIADGRVTDGKTQAAVLKTAYLLSKRTENASTK